MTKQQQAIILLIVFCVTTLLIRVQLTKSFFFGFLLWNLFLATIPYIISEFIKTKSLSKLKLILSIGIWLLFLPNAPYIITDFIHLHHLKSTLVWYDLYMLFCFAFTGILLAIISMDDIYKIIAKIYSKNVANLLILFFSFLSGFGIYLGRFLRLNSWHLFTNPTYVFQEVSNSLLQQNAWYTTLAFGLFLNIALLVYNTLKPKIK